MPLILKPSQYERVQKMIPNCCNWDEGICLLLRMKGMRHRGTRYLKWTNWELDFFVKW